jgi:serine/threonine-protein kinase
VILGWLLVILSLPWTIGTATLCFMGVGAANYALFAVAGIDVPPVASLALAPLAYAAVQTFQSLTLQRRAGQRQKALRVARDMHQGLLSGEPPGASQLDVLGVDAAYPNKRIGNYKLVELLGRGGMGEVWKAKHRLLARRVALKLIRPEVLGADEATDRDAISRFEREAQATAALRSHHTIDVYDFGISNEGCFYYVMELLDGLNLDVFVKRYGPVSCDRGVYLLRQVCRSLTEAHGNEMIHRDIKPANIYVCRLGPECDFIKVLDFGLVKTRREMQKAVAHPSVKGVVAGTPGFMAPEMATGKPGIDGRADIYSLGCVAYWLVTGQLVFEADSPLAMVAEHIQSEPTAPSKRSEVEIPESLEQVILSCLEKDPAARPQTMRELDRLLARCEPGQVWDAEKARDWWDLHMARATGA